MNKQQIKEELRRSACEDKEPAIYVSDDAFCWADSFIDFFGTDCNIEDLSDDDCRTFFLLVAEAL